MANDRSSETPLAFYRFVYQEVEGIRVLRVQALQCKVTVQEIDPILSDVIVLHNDVKRNLFYGSLSFLNDSNRTCEWTYMTSIVRSFVHSKRV